MIYFVLLNFIVYLKNVKYNQFPEWSGPNVGPPALYFFCTILSHRQTDTPVNTKHCVHLLGIFIFSGRVLFVVGFTF